jgi:hypothetical protein
MEKPGNIANIRPDYQFQEYPKLVAGKKVYSLEEEKAVLAEEEAKPSADDLDAVAAETKAAEATASPEKPKGKLWGKNTAAK